MRQLMGVSLLSGFCALVLTGTFCGCDRGPTVAGDQPIEISGPPPSLPGGSDHAHSHDGHSHDGHSHDGHSHDGHSHDGHSQTGPHGGSLIELGHDHRYHAELVRDAQASKVLIYVLDRDFKELPVEARPLTLHVLTGESAEPFVLVAGVAGDRYESTDGRLLKLLSGDARVTGKLRVTIEGTPYVGRLANLPGGARH